ncbi:ribonuclease P protein subunit p30 isoform X3 [Stigmatopora argus]
MSGFMDLNVTFCENKSSMQQVIDTAAHLGYSTVAVNYTFEATSSKKTTIPPPKPINELIDHLPIVQGRSRPIRVLNRLTLLMSDSGYFWPNQKAYEPYDLLAVQANTEKLFHAACTLLDVDVISLPVTEKLPFFLKRAPVNAAAERGLVFEVTYAPAVCHATARRSTLVNALGLTQACNGKNMMVSSGAAKPLELRGPYDVINLCSLMGLSHDHARNALSRTCRSLLLHAETRKSAGGAVCTERRRDETPVPREKETFSAPAAKRAKSRPGVSQS